jgi:hypothetical protein
MWESSIAKALGAWLGGGAQASAARRPAGTSAMFARRRPPPQTTLERPCGAGMALAGVLGELDVL